MDTLILGRVAGVAVVNLPRDGRADALLTAKATLHSGPGRASSLLLPVIPRDP